LVECLKLYGLAMVLPVLPHSHITFYSNTADGFAFLWLNVLYIATERLVQ